MANPKSLISLNDGTSVSNTSPQSPPGASLLETPITLDFDPMSFEFKEETPLTTCSDNNNVLNDMLSPSQNADIVEFFDPFCPVKEESPTDYYPNVMLDQSVINEPLINIFSEHKQEFNNGNPNSDNDGHHQVSSLESKSSDHTSPSSIHSVNEIDVFNSSNEFHNHACLNSEHSKTLDSKLEISNEIQQNNHYAHIEDTCFSPVDEMLLDDNQHDIDCQHEQYINDISRRSRTSSSSSHSSKSDLNEKKSYKIASESSQEHIKIVNLNPSKETEKKGSTQKGTNLKNESNASSYNGINGSLNIKNCLNSKKGNLNFEKSALSSMEHQIITTDLKSNSAKVDGELSEATVLEVKPSVDLIKAQQTFNQKANDEKSGLCKICGKDVYQMEKMKAEKNVFHKNCFRCKECNKLLNIDSYSSNEGDIYCQPHFRQLFQPKARFDGEDNAPRKQRRNEMIIRENIPAELPPDVVRSDSKPDHGLENIALNLSSIKSKFETYREEHHLPSTTDVCTLQRSASVMARLAKYQSAVTGDNENGEISESDNDDDDSREDATVVKSSKHKEKVVFSGMSSLKSQWETGSVIASKEEKVEEKKEELNKLRQRICLGRSESMKAVYEKACQDNTKTTVIRTDPVDLGREIKATRIKEKFEKGELVSEVEEENLEKVRKEKEDDLSVFTEPGIASDAKKLFKQMDASVKTSVGLSKSPSKSPLSERPRIIQSITKDGDIIKCSEPTEKEEIPIDTTDVSERFKFFENYSELPKERKRFQITPPREATKEESPEHELPHNPNIIRSNEKLDDIPSTDTARRMLDKFKALEKESPSVPIGPKPLKRITPPREYTKVNESHDSSPEPERDPNIIRSSYKVEDDIIVEADKAKSLRARFENWDTELKENRKTEDEDDDDFLPQVDTAKTLRAKFEAFKEDTLKPIEKPKPKVNRFIQEHAASNTDACTICGKKVYPMEKMETSGMKLHKNCFRCAHCCCMLRLENYTTSSGKLYCTPHFKQLFISRGNYDEGFGREQHKEKWNRSCNNTPIPQDMNENNDSEFSKNEAQYLEQAV